MGHKGHSGTVEGEGLQELDQVAGAVTHEGGGVALHVELEGDVGAGRAYFVRAPAAFAWAIP